jgi:uncharacterized protein (TIGR00251 family)
LSPKKPEFVQHHEMNRAREIILTSKARGTLRVHVVPNAKAAKVVGEHGGAIKVKLRAPVVEGKANAAVRRFLSEELKISERAIVLEHGHKSRDKLIRIDGLSEEDVRRRLLGAFSEASTATR